jgi:hypothetical protein
LKITNLYNKLCDVDYIVLKHKIDRLSIENFFVELTQLPCFYNITSEFVKLI